ncbi:MAG: serine/threonine-protein kinase, partial [Planctomycetota bacterium]
MTHDQTEYQTAGGRSTSQQLSMQATTPPAEVPGYRLQRFLGAGAFGQVWVGQDLNTGRPVAVKFYLHRGGVNWSLLSHEVKHLVQLSADRQVVQVLEVGWDSDPPYYVMELIEGGSLEDLLKRRGRIPVQEAVDLFHRICVGLNHCHGKGVLHCDIKPANILIADDREPRLVDFGQSRMTHDQTPALGTLFYMAPEQADLKSTPDASWDVYAAGAILFRMLTGRLPYRDEKLISEIDTAGSLPKRLKRYQDAIRSSPSPLEALNEEKIDRPLARIVSRCLAADPEERYVNVQQILNDLRRRQESRARRPLMLLGLVGPLLLLLATCVFAARTIDSATRNVKAALRNEAFGSNRLVARHAASNLEGQLERYFVAASKESDAPDLRQWLDTVLSDEIFAKALDEIQSSESADAARALNETRTLVLDHPSRMQLDDYLGERLQQYRQMSDPRQPRLDTLFVTDSHGTIFGI